MSAYYASAVRTAERLASEAKAAGMNFQQMCQHFDDHCGCRNVSTDLMTRQSWDAFCDTVTIKDNLLNKHLYFVREGMLQEAHHVLQLLLTGKVRCGLDDESWRVNQYLEKLPLRSRIDKRGIWEEFYFNNDMVMEEK